MNIRYRFVPFGTRFESHPGERADSSPATAPNLLFENELAVDIGGICWGLDGEERCVIDHHFFRPEGQFPSAAAGVLHLSQRIGQRFAGRKGDVWIVTHRLPDFDALSASYLARCLIEGSLPADDGWQALGLKPEGWFGERGEIRWFQPEAANLPADRRWAIHIASEAARVDQCRRGGCPAHRTLHAVLYAAMYRGRNYQGEQSSATEFFAAARQILQDDQRRPNPYFDSIFEGNSRFQDELALLDRERDAYRRDISRARRTIVFLQSSPKLENWYPQVQAQPLVGESGEINPAQLRPPQQQWQQADGLFLRDPECLLFKEWARQDTENSTQGRGFLFTAIAYSQGRPHAARNQTEYYFSLDMERAQGQHLYNLWARLQAAEVAALPGSLKTELAAEEARRKAEGRPSLCRSGYEPRAGQTPELFDDPWFDGGNFSVTIVATPARGSMIGEPGQRSDLRDDPVARIVDEEVHSSILSGGLYVNDRSATTGEPSPRTKLPISLTGAGTPPADHFRYLSLQLDPGIDPRSGQIAEQVGSQLWRSLDAANPYGVPDDFAEIHLLQSTQWIAVWHRCGVALAYKPAAASRDEELRRLFDETIRQSVAMRSLLAGMRSGTIDETHGLAQSERLLRDYLSHAQNLTEPENVALLRFVEASRLDELLGSLRDLNQSAAERSHARSSLGAQQQQTEILGALRRNADNFVALQHNVEWVEVGIVVVYAAELLHILGDSFHFSHDYIGRSILIFSVIVASAAITALGLWPWQHHKKDGHIHVDPWRPFGLGLFLLLGIGGFLYWGQFHLRHESTSHGSPQEQATQKASEALPASDTTKTKPAAASHASEGHN